MEKEFAKLTECIESMKKDSDKRSEFVRCVMALNEKASKLIPECSKLSEKINPLENNTCHFNDFKQVMEFCPELFLLIDSDGQICLVNTVFKKKTGYSQKEILNKRIWEIDATHEKEDFYKAVEAAEKDEDRLIESRLITKQGDYIDVEIKLNSMLYNSGKYFVCFLRDISDRKRYWTELEEAQKKSEKSNELKTSFLYNMSHEIRSPLNSIIGFAQLLHDQADEKDRNKQYLGYILNNSNMLLKIIEDLLEVSRIEADKIELKNGRCCLNQIMEDSFFAFQGTVKKSGKEELDFELELPAHSVCFNSDAYRIRQILSNLLNNALKFTYKGYLRLGCKLERLSKESGMLNFFVKDTGRGISETEIAHIFKRFYQTKGQERKENSGVGLGLSIASDLAVLLGGSLDVESELGVGSVFYFRLPVSFLSESNHEISNHAKEKEDWNLEGRKIIIAEDSDTSYELLYEILSSLHASVLRAVDGEDAYGVWKENRDADLVLIDINMPRKNGFYTIEKISTEDPEQSMCAVSAYATDEDKKKALDMGCVNYITKPVKIQEFLQVLKELLMAQPIDKY